MATPAPTRSPIGSTLGVATVLLLVAWALVLGGLAAGVLRFPDGQLSSFAAVSSVVFGVLAVALRRRDR